MIGSLSLGGIFFHAGLQLGPQRGLTARAPLCGLPMWSGLTHSMAASCKVCDMTTTWAAGMNVLANKARDAQYLALQVLYVTFY